MWILVIIRVQTTSTSSKYLLQTINTRSCEKRRKLIIQASRFVSIFLFSFSFSLSGKENLPRIWIKFQTSLIQIFDFAPTLFILFLIFLEEGKELSRPN